MRVSLLIPTNRGEWIPWLFHQILKNILVLYEENIFSIEVLVATELPAHLFKKFPKCRVIKCNGTVGVKRNLLVREAKGQYCFFFDDDDWYSSQRVLRHYKLLRNGVKTNNECGKVFNCKQFPDIITCNTVLCYNVFDHSSYLLSFGSESCMAFKRYGAGKFSDGNRGEGNQFVVGKKVYYDNDVINIVALSHNRNTGERKDGSVAAESAEHLFDDHEKKLLGI